MSNSQEYSGLTSMQLSMVRSRVHDDKLNIIDCDAHFTVDTINKIIVNADKRKFVQFSHNSERVTFDCDRYIEGHDITECNVKQIHYLDDGIYDIDDLTINEDDDTKVTFSWLISGNVTKDVLKSVPFSLILECVREDGVCTYSWDTEENTSLYVVKGRRNSHNVAYQYADVLEQWKKQFGGGGSSDFIINITACNSSTDLVADKTYNEIGEARDSGKNCIVVYFNSRYEMMSQRRPLQYEFEKIAINGEVIENNIIVIKDDNTVTFTQSTLDFGQLSQTVTDLKNSGKGWTTEQIDLLDSLLSLIPFTSFEGGTIADRLITSLRSNAVEPDDNPSDNPDVESGVIQNGRVLTIVSGVATSQNGTTLLIA